MIENKGTVNEREVGTNATYYFRNCDVNQINNDLYYVLVEKTTGEAASKVKSVDEGMGFWAYFAIYWWFVKTSGVAIQERSRKAMQPEPISKEEK